MNQQQHSHGPGRAWRHIFDERASNVAQSAAVALLSLALIGAVLLFAPPLRNAAERTVSCLVSVLGGSAAGCEGGAAALPAVPETENQEGDDGGWSWGGVLDVVQVGLDVAGVVPGLGEFADGANGLISLARGDYTGAALSFGAMVPFLGTGATIAKHTDDVIGLADEAGGLADEAGGLADEAGGLTDEAGGSAGRQADDAPVSCSLGGKAPGLSKPTAAPCIAGQPGGYRTREDFDNGTNGYFDTPEEADAAWRAYQDNLNTGDTPVIGRQADTAVAEEWPDHTILNNPDWTLKVNDAWIQAGIDRRARFYVGSPINPSTLTHPRYGETVFKRELDQLELYGYRRVGDYMEPPVP